MRYISVLLLFSLSWIQFCWSQTTYVATLQLPDNLFNYKPTSQDFTGVATTTDGITEFKLQCDGFALTLCVTDANGLNPSLYFNVSSQRTHYNLTTSGLEDCGPTVSQGGTAACTFTPADLLGGNEWMSTYSTDTNGDSTSYYTTLVSYLTSNFSSIYPVTFTYLEAQLASDLGATDVSSKTSTSSSVSSTLSSKTSPSAAATLATPTASPTSTPSGTGNGPGPSDLTSREKIGIGLGLSLGIMAIIVAGVLIYRRRKSKTKSSTSGAHLYFSQDDKDQGPGETTVIPK